MIIGAGDIASILVDRDGAIFFASGVSNSNEFRNEEFDREKNLLLKQDKTQCIFYFSSITIDYREKFEKSRYLQHKLEMENLIKNNFENYNIIRIGNISWGTNPNTFLNYIRGKMKNGEIVEIKDEYKYMIDKEHILLLTNNLPLKGKNIISVFGRMAKVKDLI